MPVGAKMKTSDHLVDLRVLELEARSRLKPKSVTTKPKNVCVARRSSSRWRSTTCARPLSAIVVYSELLMNKVMGDLDDRQLEPIRTIHRNCTNLIRMAEDVLTSAQVRAGSIRLRLLDTDLLHVVQEAVRSPPRGSPRRSGSTSKSNGLPRPFITLSTPTSFPAPSPTCWAMRSSSVPARRRDPHWPFERDDDEIRVAITDQGPGISPEKRLAIFERFRRGDTGDQNGHGLGLAIAKFFIELHGGRILVEGVRGRGSTFLVGLPIDNLG
jgi:light-regulated signal transduction histidine kinase (bacteriophytochrome)